LLPPQPKNTRLARTEAFGPQQRRDPTVAEPRTLPHQLQHPLNQAWLVATRLRPISLARTRLANRSTRPPLGETQLQTHLGHRRPLPGRAQKFPSATIFKAWMSNA